MVDPSKSFEVSDDGITIDGGVHLSSGSAVPTHNADQGSRYWRVGTNEVYQQRGPGNTNNWVLETDTSGDEHQAFFYGKGSIGNKWLAVGASSKTSDQIPYTIVDDVEIDSISWTNSNSTLNVTIEVYKNGTAPVDLVASYPILNKKTMAKSDITPISCNHGDRLSIYLRSNGSNAGDPALILWLKVINTTNSEVST